MSIRYEEACLLRPSDWLSASEQVEQIEAGIADLMQSTMVDGQVCVDIIPREQEPDAEDYVIVQKSTG